MKLYIGNLPFEFDEEALKGLFSGYKTEEITLIKDRFSGRSKGFGFVTISDDEEAKKAISELNGKDIQGRELKISEAKPMEERPERARRDFDRGPRRDFRRDSGRDSGRRNFSQRRF